MLPFIILCRLSLCTRRNWNGNKKCHGQSCILSIAQHSAKVPDTVRTSWVSLPRETDDVRESKLFSIFIQRLESMSAWHVDKYNALKNTSVVANKKNRIWLKGWNLSCHFFFKFCQYWNKKKNSKDKLNWMVTKDSGEEESEYKARTFFFF